MEAAKTRHQKQTDEPTDLSQRNRSRLNQSLHQNQNHSMSKSQLLPLARLGIEIFSFGLLLNLFPSLQDQVQVLHKVLTKRDIVDVTDPVHSIAAQALADLGYQPQPQRKPNQ